MFYLMGRTKRENNCAAVIVVMMVINKSHVSFSCLLLLNDLQVSCLDTSPVR